MAAKKVTIKPVAKPTDAAAKPIVSKTEENKAEVKKEETPAAVKAEVKPVEKKAESKKAEAKKAEVKKAPAKKAESKKTEAKKAEVKKAEAKKAPAKKASAKKTELKTEINVQYGETSYSQEDLVKIAKDVWKYDLKQKASDLTSIVLYAKTEERRVYYVMNKEFKGDFGI